MEVRVFFRFTMCDVRCAIYDVRFTIYDVRFTIYDVRGSSSRHTTAACGLVGTYQALAPTGLLKESLKF